MPREYTHIEMKDMSQYINQQEPQVCSPLPQSEKEKTEVQRDERDAMVTDAGWVKERESVHLQSHSL